MKIKRNDFPIFPLNYPQQAKLVKSSRIVARAVDKLSTLFILDPRPEGRRKKRRGRKLAKRGKKEKETRKIFALGCGYAVAAATTWTSSLLFTEEWVFHVGEFSGRDGTIASHSSATAAWKYDEKGWEVNWWTEGRWRRGDVEDSRTSIDSSKERNSTDRFPFLFFLLDF